MKDIEFLLTLEGKVVGFENHYIGSNGLYHLAQEKFTGPKIGVMRTDFHKIGLSSVADHDTKLQYTNYNDYDDKHIFNQDIIEIESGRDFIGHRDWDITLHKVEWCPEYGSWVLIGINSFTEDGVTPTKRCLNGPTADKNSPCYRIMRTVGNTIHSPDLLKVTSVFSKCEEILGHIKTDGEHCQCQMRRLP